MTDTPQRRKERCGFRWMNQVERVCTLPAGHAAAHQQPFDDGDDLMWFAVCHETIVTQVDIFTYELGDSRLVAVRERIAD